MDAFAESTTVFDDDEAFLPNPEGSKAHDPGGCCHTVSERHRALRRGRGLVRRPRALPVRSGYIKRWTPKTIRVEEILSLKRLIMEGNKLDNCLEDRRSSQVKYVLRARQRTSSFWSFTIADPDGSNLKHVLLLEVWHLRRGNVVRAGGGSRGVASPNAWHWMEHWCDREGVDWRTWDVRSRLACDWRTCDY